MVVDKTIHNVLRRLEIYFLKNNDYRLSGKSYDLILIIPSETSYTSPKYSWIISAKFLDNKPQKDVINELISDFKQILSFEEFNSISRVNTLNSNHPFVKNLNFVFPYQEDLIEVNELAIGGVRVDRAYILRSKILEKVKTGRAVVFVTNQGESIQAGIISMDNKFKIKHYTDKGLRVIFKPETDEEKIRAKEIEKQSEQLKIQNEYISFTNLKDIYSVR